MSRINRLLQTAALLLLAALYPGAAAEAIAVPIVNPGFDADPLAPGGVEFIIALALPGALSEQEEAQRGLGCTCWCKAIFGAGDPGKSIDNPVIAYPTGLTFGNCTLDVARKKRECSARCTELSRNDAQRFNDDAWLCRQLNRDYDGAITAYSAIGTLRYETANGRKVQCKRCCDCPDGWYDRTRQSCVTGACDVPGMPNGDKGGGYFAWQAKLFKDIPGATNCQVEPGAGPCQARCPNARWTPWLDRDNAGGVGDFEDLRGFVAGGQACAQPVDIQCQTTAGVDWQKAGQRYTCDVAQGGICRNDQNGGRCLDYRVRFLCCP